MPPNFKRDTGIFNDFMAAAVGRDRTRYLCLKVFDVAKAMPGPPSELNWFKAWSQVLDEEGTEADSAAARQGLLNVKKLWDAGY